MADTVVGVLEPVIPSKYIDNELVVNDKAQSVARQKVSVPDASQLLFEILQRLETIASNTAMPDTSRRTRVAIESGTLPTVTTVTTVTTCSNLTSIGGINAALQQPALTAIQASMLYERIIVS